MIKIDKIKRHYFNQNEQTHQTSYEKERGILKCK